MSDQGARRVITGMRHGWSPAAGVRLPHGGAVTSFAAVLRVAGVLG